MTLYSYRIRFDTGLAPNPFWGVCTLVICKPAIRRKALVGDWIVGLGTTESPVGDISGKVVYAMKVTRRMTMREYDEFCLRELPEKIPDLHSRDPRRGVGDCQYEFGSSSRPRIRAGVHGEENRVTDLGGENALLSDHFYYFGDHPIPLPPRLLCIDHPRQGHKSSANDPVAEAFVKWIEGLSRERNGLFGIPAFWTEVTEDSDAVRKCGSRDLEQDLLDQEEDDADPKACR